MMLTSILTACGESSDTIASQNDTAADTTSAETTTEDPGPQLELPDGLDYNGYTFTFLTQTNYNNNFKLAVESDGDAINDAAYERNALISEKLNIKFKAAEFDNPYETLKASVMAGEQVYDYVLPHATTGVAAMVTEGLLYDWNKLDYVDFDNPWWNGRMTESLGIGGKLFYASGDIVMAWQGMQAVLFNKTYLDNMNLQKDLYDTVFDKEWTIDYMTKIIKGLSADVNGDGVIDKLDYSLIKRSCFGTAEIK